MWGLGELFYTFHHGIRATLTLSLLSLLLADLSLPLATYPLSTITVYIKNPQTQRKSGLRFVSLPFPSRPLSRKNRALAPLSRQKCLPPADRCCPHLIMDARLDSLLSEPIREALHSLQPFPPLPIRFSIQ